MNRKLITEGQYKCLLVFSILLELDQGALIEDLRSHEVNDASLPIGLPVLRTRPGFKMHPGLAERFEQAQWKYCPLKFELDERRPVYADHVIPICLKRKINEGGTSHVYEIVVQEEFVSKALAESVPRSRFVDPRYDNVSLPNYLCVESLIDHPQCHIFALKTFKPNNEDVYENERSAFSGLSGNEGMVKCLFTYSQVGAKSPVDESASESFHLVLELGELDLHQYFHYYLPPVFPTDQSDFWSQLFLVAHATKNIHIFDYVGLLGIEKYLGYVRTPRAEPKC